MGERHVTHTIKLGALSFFSPQKNWEFCRWNQLEPVGTHDVEPR